ncbi:hypothetical protein EJO69_07875 [Flaviflexus salsibiostraticola]|uniref:Uncharacterized protein n=1 Tax=Flaviflexus salsibiostraticola TaxID=1282737 RepID=A0A3Q8WVS2_9ACTO|nr:hypothetical protein [Flaviflexus salsibiostraticola]AZN30231.1 hypothetical protein EJO69_07875 [Flaviflexus salsibiostraticola]
MSNTYSLPLTPGQVRGFTENGLDYISGLAVIADDIDEITEIPDLIELFQLGFEGSPFKTDEPFYSMELVAGPLVQSRRAVGPLHPEAFLGGIFEVLPFDATGVAKAAGLETSLLWVEPARVTAGSTIWKHMPGEDEPEMVAAYHGVAYGWETEAGFKAIVPSNFIGTVIKRSWGEIPCDVEIEDGRPVAVTLVSPAEPPTEEGFEQIESGLWAKRLAYSEDMEIYESQKIAKVDGLPARVLRPIRRDNQTMLEVQALLPDAPYARANGYSRYAPTVFVKAVPLEGMKAQVRNATPTTWVIDDIRPAMSNDMVGKDLTDTTALIPDMFKLLVNAVPDGFSSITLFMQIVGNHFVFLGEYTKDGETERLTSIPTSLVHYTRQLKKNTYTPEDGGFFLAKFVFDSTGTGNFGFNKQDQPMWASQVPVDDWKKDLEEYPRPGSATPDWLIDATTGRLVGSAAEEDS